MLNQLRKNVAPAVLALVAIGTFNNSLQCAAADAEVKPPTWETTATAGATVTRGNSKTLLFTAGLLTQKKWQKNDLKLVAGIGYKF